jgi:hypothetical protein
LLSERQRLIYQNHWGEWLAPIPGAPEGSLYADLGIPVGSGDQLTNPHYVLFGSAAWRSDAGRGFVIAFDLDGASIVDVGHIERRDGDGVERIAGSYEQLLRLLYLVDWINSSEECMAIFVGLDGSAFSRLFSIVDPEIDLLSSWWGQFFE